MPWYAWIIFALGASGLFLNLLGPVFPAAELDFAMQRGQIEKAADAFLDGRGIERKGYTRTLRFRSYPRISHFMQQELGKEAFTALLRAKKLPLWYWQVRYVRPFDRVQHEVCYSPEGTLVEFEFGRPHGEASTHPERDEAEKRCRAYLGELGFPSGWVVVETKAEQLPARLDRYFIFQAPDMDLGLCRRRVYVKLKGEGVAAFRHFLRAPDSADEIYQRNLAYGGFLFQLSLLTDGLLLILAFWQFLLLFKADATDGRKALRLALVVYAVLILALINFLPTLTAASYQPWEPLWTFVGQQFFYFALASLGIAVAAFLGSAAGEGLADELWGQGVKTDTLFACLRGRFFDPAVTAAFRRGCLFALFGGGTETWFYYLGQKYFSVFLPVRADYLNVLGSPLPLLFPLSIGVAAALTEESLFRLFGASFFLKVLKSPRLAYVVPALAWAFAHSYEPVFPVYVRGLELLLGGVIFTWVFLRFDLLTVVVCHYMYDVVAYGWPLLTSRDPWLTANGILPLALVLIPALTVWKGRKVEPTKARA